MGANFLAGPVLIGQEVMILTKRGLINIAYKEEVFHSEGGKTLEHVVQIGDGCPMPGNIQGQAGLS